MTSAITRLKLLGDRADQLTRFQADAEQCEIERKRAREEREARAQQRQAATITQESLKTIDDRILATLDVNFSKGAPLFEGIAEAIGVTRAKTEKQLRAEIAALRDELKATATKLQERHARLPTVKAWEPDAVHYCGDVVTHDGSVWRARKDTGKEPGHSDWILLARAGHDGCDGLSPNVCGVFDPGKKYWRLDIVEFRGASYIARCDDPGACPGDDDTGWQLLTRGGPRGDTGAIGPRGRKGERGARGQDAPTIISWVLDHRRYTAIPTMSDGTAGAPLELRGLFEQFLIETGGVPFP